ncbi:hypothetical protein CLV35_3782 [Motilibacter peucedani]|uniref:Uncharacterized protein n=1 Tax=Motilibacter peucedani TaxID=598650 RepID=A0A420XJM8_9ACTN|nr:hypothetical protein [Motilibacter peucedani]RKS67879.1 hypothetical protein CLV35_3782 [Motilibacter peucedani]
MAIVDAIIHPQAAWQQVGRSKLLWAAGLIVGLWIPVLGSVAALVYLIWLRPQLRAAHRFPA